MTKKKLGEEPVAPPTRALGATFDAKLRGALPPRKRTTAPVQQKRAATAPADAEPAKTAAKKARRATPKKTSAKPPPLPDAETPEPPANASQAADAALTRGRVLYLTDADRDALAMACTQQRKTRTVLVLDAIEATYEQLADLVREDLQPKVVHGKLWDSVVTPSRMAQPPKRQVFITPTIEQLRIIDQLVTDTEARDRSHLVSVALRAHLA